VLDRPAGREARLLQPAFAELVVTGERRPGRAWRVGRPGRRRPRRRRVAMVRPRRRSALPWQPPSPSFAWSRLDVIQLHFQIMSIRTRASRWQGPGGPGGTGRQSWLTRCEGEAVDCTARRSSGSGTTHAAVGTTEGPSRTADPVHPGVAVCNGSEVVASVAGQLPAGRAGARPVIFSLSSHNSRAAVSSRAAADGSRRCRLT